MGALARAARVASRGRREYLFGASLLVLFVSVVEILDFFELPFESLVVRLLTSGSIISAGFVTSSLSSSGYLGLFALMALESASLPIPSEVVLPFAGYMASTGVLSFGGVVAVSTGAGVIGALVDYYLALKLGRPAIEKLLRWSGAGPDALGRAESWINRRGSWSILVARFIPGLRSAISLPAGALRMRMSAFIPMTVAGSFGWSVLLVYAGYSAGDLWRTGLAQYSPLLTNYLMFAAAAASSSYMMYYFVSRRLAHPRARGAAPVASDHSSDILHETGEGQTVVRRTRTPVLAPRINSRPNHTYAEEHD
ncbi:MAG TPA: DedA family protein [Nitrososphaerales archaeon]|nr:DedA family protein [Nitrososphaerales archaeon]